MTLRISRAAVLTLFYLCAMSLQADLMLLDWAPFYTDLQAGTAAIKPDTVERPAEEGQVTIGMRKEDVRARWGAPAEVRKNRTCFGTAEEWVYRGDPQRYGADERVLSFDEWEVLTEIR
ncbi:MAG: hypothetical protein ACREOH_21550 [Candidatus Entotheonellia bacterium]